MKEISIWSFDALQSKMYVGLNRGGFDFIFRRYNNYKEKIELNKTLGRFVSYFYYVWIRNKRAFRLSQLLDILNKLDIDEEEIEKFVTHVRTSRSGYKIPMSRFPIPLDHRMAILVGHAISDGHIKKRDLVFDYTNNYHELRQEVISSVRGLLGIKKYYSHPSGAGIPTITFPSVVGSIIHLAGAPVGNKTRLEYSVPSWITLGGPSVKRSFLRALFDDEGTIKLSKYELLIKFAKTKGLETALDGFLGELNSLLHSFGIERPSIRKDNEYRIGELQMIQKALCIHGHANFKLFQKQIGFNASIKKKRLARLIGGYKVIKLRNNEGVELVLNNLRTKGKTRYEIAKELNMSPRAVYKHLRKLAASNRVSQTISSRNEPAIWRLVK
jgi:intein/homing endonuclease